MSKKRLAPGRTIALGFALLIFLGTLLLILPASHVCGVKISFIDALFTATSAVCVTGLSVAETATTFSLFGRVVLLCLIQIGGLGFASIGVGFFMMTGKRVSIRERTLIREAMNYPDLKGILKLVESVLLITFGFEFIGTILCLLPLSKHFPFMKALGLSFFHAVSSFNNAGFDIFGTGDSLYAYRNDLLMNLITAVLVFSGGLGFFVFMDVARKRSFKKLSLHSKVVLATTAILLLGGTLLIKLSEEKEITWLGALFYSVSTRTAGFSTYPVADFKNGTLLIVMALMFVGASPGSTGGGIKTTTLYILLCTLLSSATNRETTGFNRKIPRNIIHKAFVIMTLGIVVVFVITFCLCLLEPDKSFAALLFETVSAFGTVGLSMNITPNLSAAGKFLITLTMYIGRLGPLTVATLWLYSPDSMISRPEESLSVG